LITINPPAKIRTWGLPGSASACRASFFPEGMSTLVLSPEPSLKEVDCQGTLVPYINYSQTL